MRDNRLSGATISEERGTGGIPVGRARGGG